MEGRERREIDRGGGLNGRYWALVGFGSGSGEET